MHCPGGNATDPIWRVLTSSDEISSWNSLKPQQSNPNRNPVANQLWSIDFLTPRTTLIIPHRLPVSLNLLWCSIHARCFKSSLKHYIRFCGIFTIRNTTVLPRAITKSLWTKTVPAKLLLKSLYSTAPTEQDRVNHHKQNRTLKNQNEKIISKSQRSLNNCMQKKKTVLEQDIWTERTQRKTK